jgi:hypothetical protein
MLLFTVITAHGQTSAEMESLLEAKEISTAEAAYFVLAGVSENPPQNPEAAFVWAREKGWLPGTAESKGGMTLGNFSLLVMRAFGIEGGLMYRVFPVSRYAFRAMVSRGFIEGRAYPGQKVSGGQFLRVLERVMAEGEGND